MSESKKMFAFLVKQTVLPNDDVILELLTDDDQKISVFATKLARSKKRRAEIDFFRLLEIVVTKTKTSWRLKSVVTNRVFNGCQSTYQVSRICFAWLKELHLSLQAEKPIPGLFKLLEQSFASINDEQKMLFDSYWHTQLLVKLGMFPPFTLNVSDQYFDPWQFQMVSVPSERTFSLSLLLRKYLLFMAQCSFDQLIKKSSKLENVYLNQVCNFSQEMLKQVKD